MASELDDALRAAASAASAANAQRIRSIATQQAGSPATRRNKNAKSRVTGRRRVRSDSMASESNAGGASAAAEDPVKRLEAFKARMFDASASVTTFTTAGSVKPTGGGGADDVGKLKLKAKKEKMVFGDDVVVPQLTRVKVVVPNNTTKDPNTPATFNNHKKKKNKKKNKKFATMTSTGAAAPVVFEIVVPPPPQQRLAQETTAASNAKPQRTTTNGVVATSMAQTRAVDIVPAAPVNKTAGTTSTHSALTEDTDQNAATTRGKTAQALPRASHPATQKKPASTAPGPTASTTISNNISLVSATQPGKKTNQKKKKPTPKAPPPPQPLQPKSKPHQQAPKTAATTQPKPAIAVAKATVKAAPPLAPVSSPAVQNDTDDQEDMWDINSLVQKNTMKQTAKSKAISTRKRSISEDDDEEDSERDNADDSEEEEGDHKFDTKLCRDYRVHLFSQLIDEAAREQWELVEVGRLVRIFSAQWAHKKKKTARFLRRFCPELVSVDFLEGLNMALSPSQLLLIFERGSGSPVVLMNKIASAVENGNLSVRDDEVQQFVAAQACRLATNQEVVLFLMPLLESLSSVKDVGVLLKTICDHWHVDRTTSLVQEILLTPVFDDLEGQPDELLEDLPRLEGRLDFPSCMDDEDADENGNLEGLIARDESDLGESDALTEDELEDAMGEILSDDAEAEDSHAEDGVYDGETDSEEEEMMRELLNPTKKKKRSRFILDEADEDDDDGDDDDDERGEDFLADEEASGDDSSDDSGSEGDNELDDDEDEDRGRMVSAKPPRKRLRHG